MSITAIRPHLDALWKSEQAQHERAQKGEDVDCISLAELLGTWWLDWPLPFWAKWVRWVEGSSGLEPELGGMAAVNQAYADRYPHIDIQVYVRADDARVWGKQIGDGFDSADIASVYREAGPEFWSRIAPGNWGPRYWEPIEQGHAPAQVDAVKSVARDHHGVIRLCTGMVVNEQSGWVGRSHRVVRGPAEGRPER